MKLILFNPPTPDGRGFTREGRCTQEAGVWASQWPPVTLATAAACLAGDGHEVRCVDFPALGMTVRDLEAQIAAWRPDAAFWTTGTPTLTHDLRIATLVKAAAPETLTGVMGTHVSVMPGEILENSDVDVVIRGEPEGIIRELCRRGGGARAADRQTTGGVSSRNNRREGKNSSDDRAGVVGAAGGDAVGDGTVGGPVNGGTVGIGDDSTVGGPVNGGAVGIGDDGAFDGIGGGRNGGGRREGWQLSEVAGISYKRTDGAVVHNPDAGWLPPEAIPAPAWEYFDLAPYRLPLSGRPFLIVAPVRGCPYACSFCTAPIYYGRKLRQRPVAKVVAEIAANVARFGVTEFFVWADTFTADRNYVRRFCTEILAAGLKISWTCNSRVDTIDAETLGLMKKAGLWMISFGLEAGDDGILAAAGKRITIAASRRAVRLAREAGVRTAGHFILGLPGETAATMAATLRLACELPLDIAQFYAAAPFPGTRLYEEAAAKGWLQTSAGAGAAAVYSQNSAILELPGLSAAAGPASGGSRGKFSSFSQNSAVLELPGLSAAAVDAFRHRAYRTFYRRPRIIAGLLAMTAPGAAVSLAASLKRFLLSNFT